MKHRLPSLALLAVVCVGALSSCVAPLLPPLPCAPVIASDPCDTGFVSRSVVRRSRPLFVGGWNDGYGPAYGGFGGGFYGGGFGGGGCGTGFVGNSCGPRYTGGCGPSYRSGCW